jgi:hypothetical protein
VSTGAVLVQPTRDRRRAKAGTRRTSIPHDIPAR